MTNPTYTKNYNLIKPDPLDFYSVEDSNNNSEIIDAELKRLSDAAGNIDELDTQQKDSLVAAVNEIKSQVTERIAEIESQLTTGDIDTAILQRGEQTLTVEHDSLVDFKNIPFNTFKNLAALFDSGLWEMVSGWTVNAPNEATLVTTNTNRVPLYLAISVKQNTDITISCTHNGHIGVFKSDYSTPIVTYTTNQQVTFNTGNDTLIRIALASKAVAGTYNFKNVMVNEGPTAQPFVANIKGVTNPTITNKTTNQSMTWLGTFHEGDVPHFETSQVTRVKKETLLDEFKTYQYTDVNKTGVKGILVLNVANDYTFSYTTPNRAQLVKHNGAMIPQTTESIKDSSEVFGLGPDWSGSTPGTELMLIVPIADCGWGQDYSPTADEVKAYFLGWHMYDNSTGQAFNGGTQANKRWDRRVDDGTWTDVQSIVPTTQAPINSKWQPYRLVYDLATPITENVQTIGSITLAKGGNVLEVTEGRIFGEAVRPILEVASSLYHINNSHSGYVGSRLKNKVSKILNIRKNGKIDPNWTISTATNTYGNERATIEAVNYDETAVYTVDYNPLEPYKITAPLDNITIEYQSNIASVTKELVDTTVEHSGRIADIEGTMVRKGERIKLQRITLLNGWGGDLLVGKFSDGLVIVRGTLGTVGTNTSGALVAKLPNELKPVTSLAALTLRGNTAPYDAAPLFHVSYNGNITVGYNVTLPAVGATSQALSFELFYYL